jgi:polyisoprenyl-teichoic acid--peptidoglycan teichoic acid transferase
VAIGALLILGVIAGVTRVWVAVAAISPTAQPADLLALVGGSASREGSPAWRLDHGQSVNILLLGYGGPAHAGPYLTDSMLLLSLRDHGRRAVLLSIPRDLMARIPALYAGGVITARINNAYAIGVDRINFPAVRDQWKTPTGGGDLAAATVTDVTGQRTDAWVAVDFTAFRDLVDAVGGVDVDVPVALDDPRYPAGETTAYTHIHFDAGRQRMNGVRALEYARSRQTTSDLDRTARQRILLGAIRRRLASILDAPRLIAAVLAVQDDVRTNLRPLELRRLATLTSQLKDSDIKQATIDPTLLDRVPAPDGNFFLVPKDSSYGQLRTAIGASIAG